MAAPGEVKQQVSEDLKRNQTDETWRNHPNIDLITNFVMKMRDCDFYRDEFKDCTSYSGRFHQRYIYGESLDCNHYNNAYKYCKIAQQGGNQVAQDFVVRYELAKRDYRIQDALMNNVWEYRSSPPESWQYPGQHRETIEDREKEKERDEILNALEANTNSNSKKSDNSDSTKGDNQNTTVRENLSSNSETESKSKGGCVLS